MLLLHRYNDVHHTPDYVVVFGLGSQLGGTGQWDHNYIAISGVHTLTVSLHSSLRDN